MSQAKKHISRPWFVSLAFHFVLFLLSVLLTLAAEDTPSSLALVFQDERLEDEISFMEIEQVELEEVEEVETFDDEVEISMVAELTVTSPLDNSVEPLPDIFMEKAVDWNAKLGASGSLSAVPRTDRNGSTPTTSRGGQGSGAGGLGRGRNSHEPQAPNTFFGHVVYGRRIVFALDYSGSMNTPFGRVRTLRTAEADRRGLSGRERWEFITKPDKHDYKVPTLMERVVHETKKVVASLPESTEFSIVCFAHRLYELDGGLQKATPMNKDKAIDWLDKHQRGRDNEDPMLCFQRLAEISPDTVYFLSDGQFDPGIVRQVTAMNSAVVNTLGIGERKGHQNLMNLAVYSGGRFREIRYDR